VSEVGVEEKKRVRFAKEGKEVYHGKEDPETFSGVAWPSFDRRRGEPVTNEEEEPL